MSASGDMIPQQSVSGGRESLPPTELVVAPSSTISAGKKASVLERESGGKNKQSKRKRMVLSSASETGGSNDTIEQESSAARSSQDSGRDPKRKEKKHHKAKGKEKPAKEKPAKKEKLSKPKEAAKPEAKRVKLSAEPEKAPEKAPKSAAPPILDVPFVAKTFANTAPTFESLASSLAPSSINAAARSIEFFMSGTEGTVTFRAANGITENEAGTVQKLINAMQASFVRVTLAAGAQTLLLSKESFARLASLATNAGQPTKTSYWSRGGQNSSATQEATSSPELHFTIHKNGSELRVQIGDSSESTSMTAVDRDENVEKAYEISLMSDSAQPTCSILGGTSMFKKFTDNNVEFNVVQRKSSNGKQHHFLTCLQRDIPNWQTNRIMSLERSKEDPTIFTHLTQPDEHQKRGADGLRDLLHDDNVDLKSLDDHVVLANFSGSPRIVKVMSALQKQGDTPVRLNFLETGFLLLSAEFGTSDSVVVSAIIAPYADA